MASFLMNLSRPLQYRARNTTDEHVDASSTQDQHNEYENEHGHEHERLLARQGVSDVTPTSIGAMGFAGPGAAGSALAAPTSAPDLAAMTIASNATSRDTSNHPIANVHACVRSVPHRRPGRRSVSMVTPLVARLPVHQFDRSESVQLEMIEQGAGRHGGLRGTMSSPGTERAPQRTSAQINSNIAFASSSALTSQVEIGSERDKPPALSSSGNEETLPLAADRSSTHEAGMLLSPRFPGRHATDCSKDDDEDLNISKAASSDTSASSSPESGDSLVTFAKSQLISDVDVAAYMAGREMTPLQERMNAITIVPSVVFCLYFLVSGAWLSKSLLMKYADGNNDVPPTLTHAAAADTLDMPFIDTYGCVHSSWFPNLYALPPLPVLAAAFGIIVQAPFSIIYHWKYAHRLPPGFARTDHWSRRMDQAMIHVTSASMSYATSGRLDFFLANALFNLDCMFRQFKKRVRPRANKIRIGISVLAYTIPVLRRGDILLFSKLWCNFAICGWLFAKYPIGGWSHSAFHLVIAFVPPLLMTAALELPASQDQVQLAAKCFAMRG